MRFDDLFEDGLVQITDQPRGFGNVVLEYVLSFDCLRCQFGGNLLELYRHPYLQAFSIIAVSISRQPRTTHMGTRL
jgi:hypothetical protein